MLYFAYGSNLHHFQMKRRCKDSVFIKKLIKEGYVESLLKKHNVQNKLSIPSIY